MTQKYYAILDNASGSQFTFPLKAAKNEYTGAVQYAGGYPAIFGGTAAGNALATIQAETTQESRATLAVDNGAALHQIIQSTVGPDTLTFYWTNGWRNTGTPWGPPTSFATGEMSKVVTLSYSSFVGYTGSPGQILDRLIALSGAPGGTPQQKEEFRTSETAAAFVQQILNSVDEPRP